MKTKQTEALKLALEEICIKCRSNEWGFDTPRKEILNWMHDKAAQALTQSHSDEEQPAPVAKPHEQQDYWQEEARRYAQNADFWRGKYESATAQRQEPVATLWQHGETERTRITMPGDITDCDARWFKVSDLYTTPQPAYVATPRVPERKPLTDEQLYKVFPAIASYTEANKTLYRSIARAIEAAHGIGNKDDK